MIVIIGQERLYCFICHLDLVQLFDVIVEEEPINIAYSGAKLLLHMDLVYYESPPGLQLLHCLRCVYVCVLMHSMIN